MRLFLLPFLALFFYSPSTSEVKAQNIQCPSRPPLDNSNACANTAFLQFIKPGPNIYQFGGDPTHVQNSTPAFTAAAAASPFTFIPPNGNYRLDTTPVLGHSTFMSLGSKADSTFSPMGANWALDNDAGMWIYRTLNSTVTPTNQHLDTTLAVTGYIPNLGADFGQYQRTTMRVTVQQDDPSIFGLSTGDHGATALAISGICPATNTYCALYPFNPVGSWGGDASHGGHGQIIEIDAYNNDPHTATYGSGYDKVGLLVVPFGLYNSTDAIRIQNVGSPQWYEGITVTQASVADSAFRIIDNTAVDVWHADRLGNQLANSLKATNLAGTATRCLQTDSTGLISATSVGCASSEINVTDFGAVSDSTGIGNGTDNLVAFQNATAAAIAQGKTLRIKSTNGKAFRISGAGWKLDYSTPISAYGTPRTSIQCDQTSVLNFDNGDYHGLEILGATDFGVGAVVPITVSGCNFQKADNLGDAIFINRASDLSINNNMVLGWNRAVNATDNLSSVYRENEFIFNNIGMQFQRGSFSNPNAIGLYSNKIGSNNVVGITASNVADFLIDNGDIEGNGGTGGAGHGGVIINGGPIEGGVGLVLRSSHFETNSGPADVAIVATGAVGASGAIHIIEKNDFLRLSSTTFTTNNIATSGTGPVAVKIEGNAFKDIGSYVPNAARKYVANTATSPNICWGQNVYDSSLEFTQFSCSYASDVALSGAFSATSLAGSGAGITGVPISTGVSGLGTGIATALGINVGSAGAPVLFNGAGGTPTSLNLSNATSFGTAISWTPTVSCVVSGTVTPGTVTAVAIRESLNGRNKVSWSVRVIISSQSSCNYLAVSVPSTPLSTTGFAQSAYNESDGSLLTSTITAGDGRIVFRYPGNLGTVTTGSAYVSNGWYWE